MKLKHRITFSLSEELYEFVKEAARLEGRPLQNYIRYRLKTNCYQSWDKYLCRSRRPKSAGSGWVYIIHMKVDGKAYHKIGHTKYKRSRYEALDVSSPIAVDLVAEVPVDDRLGVEWLLHDFFAGRRDKGEWFDLSDRDGSGDLLPIAIAYLETHRSEVPEPETADE